LSNHEKPDWHTTPPIVCIPLAPIDSIKGPLSVNPIWQGEVLPEDDDTAHPSLCVFKHLDHTGKLAIEMTCALAASALGMDVPKPCLVRAASAALPNLPQQYLSHNELLLFGAALIKQDAFYVRLNTLYDAPLEKNVWDSFCTDISKAAKGAALDELLTNWDRHCRNLIFDGSKWWLLDHENCLSATHGQNVRHMNAAFKAHQNLIAKELLHRQPVEHSMPNAARLHSEKREKIMSMSACAAQWKHSDPAVQAIWKEVSTLLDLLSRRLPMLQHLIGERIGHTSEASALWNPPHNPTPPAA
jgi:hypothetical protein